jgi:UDP-N-acetylmuramate dehydrogenase
VIAVDIVDLHESVPVIRTLDRAQCAFSYRNSVFKQARNLLITSATLSLPLADENTLREQREIARRNTDFRTLRHPLSYPSCGSVFQNIVARAMVERVLTVWPDIRADVERSWHGKIPMAYVIRRLGLAGYRAGNAQISEKHANFISNLGQAKAGDVESLIAVVVERVHATFAFEPELEVEIAGSGVREY